MPESAIHNPKSAIVLAERVGFEPTVQFPVHSISSAASSATPAPLPIADCGFRIADYEPTANTILIRIPQSEFRNRTGGEGGIRTHGTLTGSTVFETARFNHSRTSPHVIGHYVCREKTIVAPADIRPQG